MSFQKIFSSPWFILVVILLASMAAPLNQFKVPPVLTLLMEAYNLHPAQAGLLMSVFAITGIILALPAGFIYQKLGGRFTGLIAILALILGTILGLVSSRLGGMLISRFIEGAGMSLMSIVAPALIALWFTEEKRGRAMGLWAIWVPLGSTVMFVLAPFLIGYGGWSSVWIFAGLYSFLVGLLYFFFIKPNPPNFSQNKVNKFLKASSGQELGQVFLNRDLWLISLLFCCFNFVFISFVTWAPTFLYQVSKFSLSKASLTISAMNFLSLVSCPIAGWISDKIGSRKIICLFPMFLMVLLFPLATYLKEEGFIVLVLLLGFSAGFVPPGVFAAAIEVLRDKRQSGLAMAIVQIGQNGGMLLGPLIFGLIINSAGGWKYAFLMLAPVSLVGGLAAWATKIK